MWSKFKKPEVLNGDGRWMIQTPEGYLGKTVMNGRYVYRYRYVMEQKLGRFLKEGELVHHINGDKEDDRPENLEAHTRAEHINIHRTKTELITLRCHFCSKSFEREAREYRAKIKTGQLYFFCCRSHQVSFQQEERWKNNRVSSSIGRAKPS
jgi:YHS domain-containing protein